MAKPAISLDINTTSNVHVIEELKQLPVGSDTVVVIENCYWTNNRVGLSALYSVNFIVLLNCLLRPKQHHLAKVTLRLISRLRSLFVP